MAEPKTKPTDEKVEDFLNRIIDKQKREDSFALMQMMAEITKCEPRMWGTSIVGFGTYRCVYANGSEADWPLAGFSPRVQNLTVYLMPGFANDVEMLAKLGKHRTSKVCLYFKRLSDVDIPTLKKLVLESYKLAKKAYPS